MPLQEKDMFTQFVLKESEHRKLKALLASRGENIRGWVLTKVREELAASVAEKEEKQAS